MTNQAGLSPSSTGGLTYVESVHIAAQPDHVREVISDFARIGEMCSEVAATDAGTQFVFVSGNERMATQYRLIGAENGTDVEATWELLPAGREQTFGTLSDRRAAESHEIRTFARDDVWRTLCRLKNAAEQDCRGDNPVVSFALFIAAPPERLFDMVTDFDRMGEWSPYCKRCWFEEGHGLTVGSWFTGYNEMPDKKMPDDYTGEVPSRIAVVHRPVQVEWLPGGSHARWRYTFEPTLGGTVVTESWEYLRIGIDFIRDHLGELAEDAIAVRCAAAQQGIPLTLEALRRAAEG